MSDNSPTFKRHGWGVGGNTTRSSPVQQPAQQLAPVGYGVGVYGGGAMPKGEIPAGFSRELSEAPEGKAVRVFKRSNQEDTGYREGERWFVFEGGDRAWEIVPGGVVAWAAKAATLEG